VRVARVRAACVALAIGVALVAAVPGASATAAPAAPGVPGAVAVLASDGPQLPAPQPGTGDAPQRAQQILSGREYQQDEPSALDRVIDWIEQQLNKLLTPKQQGGGSWGSVVAWPVIAVLVGIAAFLIWRLRGASRRRRRDDPLFETETEVGRTARDWITEAVACEARGAWKDALRCRFRALIADAIIRGAVRDVPGRTSGELRFEVERYVPAAAASFAAASRLFDAAWYGDEPTGADENAAFRRHAADAVAALDEAARGSRAGDEHASAVPA
jgi:hypothetical protein